MTIDWPFYTGQVSVENKTILSSKDLYYGWPANHGAWQWGDTFLFGCGFGNYHAATPGAAYASMHKVDLPIRKCLVRSGDGGLTWQQDFPCDFVGADPKPNRFDFVPEHEIYRVCGVYDHGGEDCHPHGAIYTSASRGFVWNGPWSFTGLEDLFKETGVINTSRTCVLDDLIFLSVGHRDYWGSDFVVCAKIDRDGFTYLSHIKPEDGSRCVMPSAVRAGDGKIYVACRRRNFRKAISWIELYRSDDDGMTWASVSNVGETGDPNGNPPSLLYRDGRLYCAFGNRTLGVMVLAISDDHGGSWKHLWLRSDPDMIDFGYPRLFQRFDGSVVCVYYWDRADKPASIEAAHIHFS